MGVSVALGCADVDAPSGGWVKRSSAGEALFGCSDRLQTWRLRCRGDQWIGVRHNCTSRGTFNFSEQLYSSPSDRERNTHTHTHTHTRLTALFPGLPGWAGTRKVKPNWILLKQETVSGSGISRAICKSAARYRQITTPVPHHSSFFTGLMPFLPPNQQRQSPERKKKKQKKRHTINTKIQPIS